MCEELKKATYTRKYRSAVDYDYGAADYDYGAGEVAYLVIDENCYFSGITMEATSTINAAEEIIAAISSQEGVALGKFTFFDLQTHRKYPRHSEGYFTMDKIRFRVDGENLKELGWGTVECPQEVFDAFHEYIGDPPPPPDGAATRALSWIITDIAAGQAVSGEYPILSLEEARAQGYSPTSISADIPSNLRPYLELEEGVKKAVVDNGEDELRLRQSNGRKYSVWNELWKKSKRKV